MTVAAQRARRRQRREETRAQILGAARDFLEEQPVRELSVEGVMARTGHSRTVFYRHFDDVPDLILALGEEVAADFVAIADHWRASTEVGTGIAREHLARIVEMHARHGTAIRAFSEAAHDDERLEGARLELRDRMSATMTAAITERMEAGKVSELDAQEIGRAITLMLETYLLDAVANGRRVDPERALEAVWTIWTRTIGLTEPGPARA